MKRLGFNTIFGAVLLAIFLGVLFWQSPGLVGGKLTQEEVARYLATVEKLPMPPEEKQEMIAHMRVWAEADDGKPVYMLNLMRYYETLRMFTGAPAFEGSPREANALYEKKAVPILFGKGGYVLYAGKVQEKNLVGFEPGMDHWSRVLMVRYPSRRAFLDLLTDPAYGPIFPYKFMALKLVLVPTAAEIIMPDMVMASGAILLLIFLATICIRAARRIKLPEA
jgi:hypothetical protein